MSNIQLRFDPQEVRNAIDHEPWEEDPHDRYQEVRAVGLGSVFALTPSGKFYMPWASGNVAGCPVCGGTGKTPVPLKRRVIRKRQNREIRQRRIWVKRYGYAFVWPPHIKAASAHLSRLTEACQPTCRRCGGLGSAEAHDDEVWREMAEEALGEVGLSLEASEGDSTFLLAAEYRQKEEDDEDEDEEVDE